MNSSFLKKSRKNINVLIFLFFLLTLISLFLLVKIYEKNQDEVNNKNIHILINKIETSLKFTHKIALLFSSSDEVYNFLENKNTRYINDNFRKGSYTLEDANLSFFILTDKENNLKYSKFDRFYKPTHNKKLQVFLLESLKNTSNTNKIVIFENEAYYLSKTPIYKTDYSDNSNGFLIIGSKVDISLLKQNNKDLVKIQFVPIEENAKTKIEKKIISDIYFNQITFSNKRNNTNFKMDVQISTTLQRQSREQIFIIFLVLGLSAFFIILYLSNKYKNDINENDYLIQEKIELETKNIVGRVKELEKINKNLYTIAHTDFLTKTMNRRNFFANAQKKFDFAKKNNQVLSVIMIDIDNFKKFNDNYGHSAGDKILVLFAEKIKERISSKTIFGRLGGEEFALLIEDTNLEDAIIKAERLKKEVEQIELSFNKKVVKITASFGVSDNFNALNIDEMLQNADTLLYSAKESGRNLVRSRLNF